MSKTFEEQLARTFSRMRQGLSGVAGADDTWIGSRAAMKTILAAHNADIAAVLQRILAREQPGVLNERYGHWIPCADVQAELRQLTTPKEESDESN